MRRDWSELVRCSREVLERHHPMTLRQVFYQLVSSGDLDNTRNGYQALSRALGEGRKDGRVPWEWLEDRLRRPRQVAQWQGLKDFAETVVKAYKRNVWETQELYVEF